MLPKRKVPVHAANKLSVEEQTNALAYNSSTSESTRYSPVLLVFGRELLLPNALIDTVTQGNKGGKRKSEVKNT